MLFDGILLKCCSRIQSDRTSASIYNLLYGKKSIQTVQDAHIYNLKNFYGIYRPITKQVFHNKLNQLVNQNILSKELLLTTDGEKWLHDNEQMLLLKDFNGHNYHTIAPIFSDRLLLLIQTLTNSKKQHFSFIPVIDKTPILVWMKQYYKKVKSNETAYLNGLYEELYVLLHKYTEEEATFFVDRLSGYNIYGKSTYQLAFHYHMNLADVHLTWVRMIHRILANVYASYTSYPILYSVVRDLEHKIVITDTAERTLQLLHKNYSVQEIAKIRRLKINTIYDHIVEIALFDSTLPISQYVDNVQRDEILTAIRQTNSTVLKQIKQIVDDNISYFQIRLVLATINDFTQI